MSNEFVEKAFVVAHQVGEEDDIAYAQYLKGSLCLALGNPQDAINELQQAIKYRERVGALWDMPAMLSELSKSYLALNDVETAFKIALLSVGYAKKNAFNYQLGETLCTLAQCEAEKNDMKSALFHFNKSIRLLAKSGEILKLARSQRHFAEMLIKNKQYQEAIQLLQTAINSFQQLKLSHEIAKTEIIYNSINPTQLVTI